MSGFDKDTFLHLINKIRYSYGSGPLTWSTDLAQHAENRAQHICSSPDYASCADNFFGENIYQWDMLQVRDPCSSDMFREWLREAMWYCFNTAEYTIRSKNFTQLVWNDSKYVGVGWVKKGQTFNCVTCFYPKGNNFNKFRENVFPESTPVRLSKLTSAYLSKIRRTMVLNVTFVSMHNVLRQEHHAPPLILTNTLSKFAKERAKEIALAGEYVPRKHNLYGENVFIQELKAERVDGTAPPKNWYRGLKHYDFNAGAFVEESKEFTQLIWRKTKQLGLGYTTNNNYLYVVAYYSPPGNIPGQFHKNVLPRRKIPEHTNENTTNTVKCMENATTNQYKPIDGIKLKNNNNQVKMNGIEVQKITRMQQIQQMQDIKLEYEKLIKECKERLDTAERSILSLSCKDISAEQPIMSCKTKEKASRGYQRQQEEATQAYQLLQPLSVSESKEKLKKEPVYSIDSKISERSSAGIIKRQMMVQTNNKANREKTASFKESNGRTLQPSILRETRAGIETAPNLRGEFVKLPKANNLTGQKQKLSVESYLTNDMRQLSGENALANDILLPKTSIDILLTKAKPKRSIANKTLEKMSSVLDSFEFSRNFLEAHNAYRALHGVAPLKWNRELAEYAAEWAQHLLKNNLYEYRNENEFGENLYKIHKTAVSGAEPVHYWYAESQNYSFEKPKYQRSCSQFTQLIWRDTKLVGVGVAKNNNTTIIVANYFPKGNYMHSFVENVPMRLSQAELLKFEEKKHVKPKSVPEEWEQPSYFERRKYEQEMLEAHNYHRLLHGVPPLLINRRLSNYATNMAQNLAFSGNLKTDPDYGINTHMVMDTRLKALTTVRFWYQEGHRYHYFVNEQMYGTHQFTQLLWKSTKDLGIGIAKNGKKTFIVALYSPKGNISGQFIKNVIPIPKRAEPVNGKSMLRRYFNKLLGF